MIIFASDIIYNQVLSNAVCVKMLITEDEPSGSKRRYAVHPVQMNLAASVASSTLLLSLFIANILLLLFVHFVFPS